MHLRPAREFSKGTLLFAQCDPGFCIWPEFGRQPLAEL